MIRGDFESSIRFHPLAGREFEVLGHIHTWGRQQVLYREGESERTRSLPAAWTEIVSGRSRSHRASVSSESAPHVSAYNVQFASRIETFPNTL